MVILGCEGPSEVYLLSWLLDNCFLIFDRKDILDRRPIHFRQPKDISALIDILPINEPLVFYRIGDTQKDEYNLSYFSARKKYISIKKICTKPELEILIIINEGLYDEYLKVKSKIKPKDFVKRNVTNYEGIQSYINSHDLLEAIQKYKRMKKHNKDEQYLADLIKF